MMFILGAMLTVLIILTHQMVVAVDRLWDIRALLIDIKHRAGKL